MVFLEISTLKKISQNELIIIFYINRVIMPKNCPRKICISNTWMIFFLILKPKKSKKID